MNRFINTLGVIAAIITIVSAVWVVAQWFDERPTGGNRTVNPLDELSVTLERCTREAQTILCRFQAVNNGPDASYNVYLADFAGDGGAVIYLSGDGYKRASRMTVGSDELRDGIRDVDYGNWNFLTAIPINISAVFQGVSEEVKRLPRVKLEFSPGRNVRRSGDRAKAVFQDVPVL